MKTKPIQKIEKLFSLQVAIVVDVVVIDSDVADRHQSPSPLVLLTLLISN